MTSTELLLLGLVVGAAVVAGYFIGRWASEREHRQRAAFPSPLPAPDSDDMASDVPAPRHRGPPPAADAGGDRDEGVPTPRQRRSPPPASAGGGGGEETPSRVPATGGSDPAKRVRRGPPPPASAGLSSAGDPPKPKR